MNLWDLDHISAINLGNVSLLENLCRKLSDSVPRCSCNILNLQVIILKVQLNYPSFSSPGNAVWTGRLLLVLHLKSSFLRLLNKEIIYLIILWLYFPAIPMTRSWAKFEEHGTRLQMGCTSVSGVKTHLRIFVFNLNNVTRKWVFFFKLVWVFLGLIGRVLQLFTEASAFHVSS